MTAGCRNLSLCCLQLCTVAMSFSWLAVENKPQSCVFHQCLSAVRSPVQKECFLLPPPKQAAPLGEPGAAQASLELDAAGDLCAIEELSRFTWADSFSAAQKKTLARLLCLAGEACEYYSILLGENFCKTCFMICGNLVERSALQSSALWRARKAFWYRAARSISAFS